MPLSFNDIIGRLRNPHGRAVPYIDGVYDGGMLPLPEAVTATPTPTPVVPPVAATPAVSAIDQAKAAARIRAEMAIRQRGLDPAAYNDLITSEIDRFASTFGASPDTSGAFGENLANATLQGEEARLRNTYRNQADTKFGPNYGEKVVASSLLDDTINSILEEQRNAATQYLDRGKARGIYNDVGYSAGRAALDTGTATGRSKLADLGHAVIDKYRANANQVRDKAYGAATGFTLGQTAPDLDFYAQQGDEIARRAAQFGGGDLRSAFGGTNLFDFGALTNRAGMAQGAVNLRDTDVATALAERRRVNSQQRGIGSQGAF